MNANHVGSLYPDSFGSFRIGTAVNVSLNATGNAVAQIPIVGGTEYIVRRIVVTNPSASIATANVTILTSDDGNATNAVSNAVTLSSVTGTNKWQDVGLSTDAASTAYTAGSLYVKVGTAVSGATCDVSVYGDVISL